MYSGGLRTHPCGNPIQTEMELEMVFLTLTDCGEEVQQSVAHRGADTQWTQFADELLGDDPVKC